MPQSATVLVVGGTHLGVCIAEALAETGTHTVIYSLAGVTRQPKLPHGVRVHRGGFGGVDGMTVWLKDHKITDVVLAAHPFAGQIAAHTTQAALCANLPLFVLKAGYWKQKPEDDWQWVETLEQIGGVVNDRKPRAVFLALGRGAAARLPHLTGAQHCILRIADPLESQAIPKEMFPGPAACRNFKVISAKGPFTTEAEMQVFEKEGVDLLVCKDSGLASGDARLQAARSLGISVLMLKRPEPPKIWHTSAHIHCFSDHNLLIARLKSKEQK